MHETPEQHLLTAVRKCGKFVVRGLVTTPEFINKVFDEFAEIDRVYPDLLPELWRAVPEGIRSEFTTAIYDAARPDFRYHAFFIGGRQMTKDELRRDADLRTVRVRAWATAFVSFFATVVG